MTDLTSRAVRDRAVSGQRARDTRSSLSNFCSCLRNPSLGWISRRERTRAKASARDIPLLIIRNAIAHVAERETPIRQWTNTRPEIKY